MAKQILTDLNLKGNELQKAAIENATAAPLNPSTGQIYYDTNLGKTKLFNGTTWTDDDKVYVGTEEPTDPGKTVWINPEILSTINASDVIFEDDENLEDKMETKQDILTSENAGDGIEITASSTTGKPIISNTRNSATFANITGEVRDNAKLAAALDEKIDGEDISKIVVLTKAEYDALEEIDPDTEYHIPDESGDFKWVGGNIPLGSIIEYEGTEVPNGYEEVENKEYLDNTNIKTTQTTSDTDVYSCNYVNNINQRHIKTLKLDVDQELSTVVNTTNIDLSDDIQVGNLLTTGLYNSVHGVKIGKGVNVVKVSAQVGINNTATSDTVYNLYINQNGNVRSYSRSRIMTGQAETISSGEKLIQVNENDVIWIQIYKSPQANTSSAQYQYNRTYLTVEVVD